MCQQIIEMNELSVMSTFHLTFSPPSNPSLYQKLNPIHVSVLADLLGAFPIMSHFHSLKFQIHPPRLFRQNFPHQDIFETEYLCGKSYTTL